MYNTDKNYVIQMLSSIVIQNVLENIKVTIVDDCSTVDYTDIINTFSKLLDINYIKLSENHGVGYCRNYLLDHSNCKYLTFMDSDDALYSKYSIYMLYEKIKATNSDFVTGVFIREHHDKINPLSLFKTPANSTWVFGRMYSRAFLLCNKIRFNEVRFNEDVPFIQSCLACSEHNEEINNTVYVWNYNENSLTRDKKNSEDFEFNSKISFVDGLLYAHMQKREIGVIDNKISKKQMCDGIIVCYWYFIELLSLLDDTKLQKYLEEYQLFYNAVFEDYPDIIESNELKDSYFTVLEQFTDITNKFIPRVTLWDLLSDFEVERKNTTIVTNGTSYEFG